MDDIHQHDSFSAKILHHYLHPETLMSNISLNNDSLHRLQKLPDESLVMECVRDEKETSGDQSAKPIILGSRLMRPSSVMR